MERWDFDCQKCKKNIGNSYGREDFWFQCEQEEETSAKLEISRLDYIQENYFYCFFDEKGDIVSGRIPTNKDLLKIIKKSIKEYLIDNFQIQYSNWPLLIDYRAKRIWWSERNYDKFSSENYQRAGIVKHEIQGRGWGRFGYCFCDNCAKELDYKCALCGSPLNKKEE